MPLHCFKNHCQTSPQKQIYLILHLDTIGPTCETRVMKVNQLSSVLFPWVTLKQLFFESRHLGKIVCLYCAIIRYDLYLFVARFPAATTIITAYSRDHCP